MVQVFIDGRSHIVPSDITVLQACELAQVEIPRFCYHDRLSIAGNCRMCLVEVEKSPKPVASCAMPVMDGMKVRTNTDLVKKAREGVMEFLLINHPLDCPICDQGGECDLQDQAMAFGNDRSRFSELKRAVEDKNCGPLIKMIMTRCIHCTRCIRFADEIAGVPTLGVTGRGQESEIGTYIDKVFDSELSGNVIDLCPVGALTSKPFSFTARSWELSKVESIDTLDGLGSNIEVHFRGTEVMRILPRLNESINEEWISDKTRFSYDGLRYQRLLSPMIKIAETDRLMKTTWISALQLIKEQINNVKSNEVGLFLGDSLDSETYMIAKDFASSLGISYINGFINKGINNVDFEQQYLFNTTISGIEEADLCLLIGTNPRTEAAVLNSRIRKCVLHNNLKVYSIGMPIDLTYVHTHLGNSTKTLISIIEGRDPFCQILLNAKKPMILVGDDVYNRVDGISLINALHYLTRHTSIITNKWSGFNILHAHAGSVGKLSVGIPIAKCFKKGSSDSNDLSHIKVAYVIGMTPLPEFGKNTFVIYQGHHGDIGIEKASVLLPSTAYTEKEGTYMNIEGRVQRTAVAVSAPSDLVRDDWSIIRAMFDIFNINISYKNINDVRERIIEVSPEASKLGLAIHDHSNFSNLIYNKNSNKIYYSPLVSSIDNFYRNNAISKASVTMARCASMKKISNFI